MTAKLRVALLLAAVALVTGAAFLVREFIREPADGQGPVAPAVDTPGKSPVASSSLPAKVETLAIPVQPPFSKPTSPVAASTPDPRLPVSVPPKPAPSPIPPAPAPVAVNPAPAGGPMPPSPTNPAATVDQREAAVLDLDKVTLMFRDFRSRMGENPTGTNAEIMKAVMGGNPKGALLGPPENQSLNAAGELVDRWGTPLFFHQMSRTDMEIRSAGPDRQMWTEDDILAH